MANITKVKNPDGSGERYCQNQNLAFVSVQLPWMERQFRQQWQRREALPPTVAPKGRVPWRLCLAIQDPGVSDGGWVPWTCPQPGSSSSSNCKLKQHKVMSNSLNEEKPKVHIVGILLYWHQHLLIAGEIQMTGIKGLSTQHKLNRDWSFFPPVWLNCDWKQSWSVGTLHRAVPLFWYLQFICCWDPHCLRRVILDSN